LGAAIFIKAKFIRMKRILLFVVILLFGFLAFFVICLINSIKFFKARVFDRIVLPNADILGFSIGISVVLILIVWIIIEVYRNMQRKV
jgi:hypothetical protein